jgi:hypothetical protein
MTGLRVYTKLEAPLIPSAAVTFYTRRSEGPYYRWRYEEIRGQWRGSRMHSVDLEVVELVLAPWKGLPAALKSTLSEHYVE